MKFLKNIYYGMLLGLFSMQVLGIEGGIPAEEKRWDYSVLLHFGDSLCSGTLLKNGYVLTAAHCVSDDQGKVVKNTVQIKNPRETLGNASLVFVDPQYSPQAHSNDVALFRLDNPSIRNKYPKSPDLMTSERFAHILGGDYPYRQVLVIGYGNDENHNLGKRKLYFGQDFSVSHEGKFVEAERPTTGRSRPGDSGSGIYFISNNKVILGAVVSYGTGEYKYNFNVETSTEQERELATYKISVDSFIAPSLCRLESAIANQIGFNQSACTDVERLMNILNNPDENSALYLLWARMFLENSPYKESAYYRFLSKYYLVRAFSYGANWHEEFDSDNLDDFIKYISPFNRSSYFNKEQRDIYKSQLREMASSFVDYGYFPELTSDYHLWNWTRMEKALKQMHFSDDYIFSHIYDVKLPVKKSAKCKYNICLERFELDSDSLVKSEKGDWGTLLRLNSKSSSKKIIDYDFLKKLMCFSSDDPSFKIKQVEKMFTNLGVANQYMSITNDVSKNKFSISYKKKPIDFVFKHSNKSNHTLVELSPITFTDKDIKYIKNRLLNLGYEILDETFVGGDIDFLMLISPDRYIKNGKNKLTRFYLLKNGKSKYRFAYSDIIKKPNEPMLRNIFECE